MAEDGFDKINVDELVILLIDKTEEYIGLMDKKDADGIELRDLKLQIENLRAIIAYRRSL